MRLAEVLEKEFLLHLGQSFYGPADLDDLEYLYQQKFIELSTVIYSEKTQSFSMLGDLPSFLSTLPSPPEVSIDHSNIYLFKNGKTVGPYSRREIEVLLHQKKASLFDFIYREGHDDNWIRIKEYPLFAHLLPPQGRSIPSDRLSLDELYQEKKISSRIHGVFGHKNFDEKKEDSPYLDPGMRWVICRGQEEIGPFEYHEIVRMIQKKIFDKNQPIRRQGEDEWKTIDDYSEFSMNYIKQIIRMGNKEIEKLFVERKHKRSIFMAPVILSIQGTTIYGTCTSISAGGLFLECRIHQLKVYDSVHVKILPGSTPLSFEAKAQIVSINETAPKGVAVKFKKIDPLLYKKINDIVVKILDNLEVDV